MKFTLAFVSVVLFGLAVAVHVQDTKIFGDENLLVRQQAINKLFKHIHQHIHLDSQLYGTQTFNLKERVADYTNTDAVRKLVKYVTIGMLPRDEVFSIFNEVHLKQAIALYKVLQCAKDFRTFYETALWARNHVNQGMFLYCVSVAIIHRPDTTMLRLPKIYEIYPHYFVNAHTIEVAEQIKQKYAGQHQPAVYTVLANHTGTHHNVHVEQSLSYFIEDVGINAFYYYYNLYCPFWMDKEEYGVRTHLRGEEYYYTHQQLLARYYLERLSNNMGEIKTIDYEEPIETGYTPVLTYPNGYAFPQRPNFAKLWLTSDEQISAFNGKYVQNYIKVKDLERRIRAAIDSGFVMGENGQMIDIFTVHGFNTLGNLIQANPQSLNTKLYSSLQMVVRQLLGYAKQPLDQYKLVPSALEHFETCLRDPAFWQMYKKIILYFQSYKQQLPVYTYDQLNFEGVKVQDIQVDRMITYFDKYEFDITNAVYMTEEEKKIDSLRIMAQQYRLNHKPFNYKINVVSDKTTKAVVRMFLGPKYDEHGRYIHINDNRMNFVELDKFFVHLTTGQNVIERNSQESTIAYEYDAEKMGKYETVGVWERENAAHIKTKIMRNTFPNRYMLPKGKINGMVFQMYVIVSEYVPLTQTKDETFNKMVKKHSVNVEQTWGDDVKDYSLVGLGVERLDAYPLGYPFDKPIDITVFDVRNSLMKDVKIYHKNVEDIMTTTENVEQTPFERRMMF